MRFYSPAAVANEYRAWDEDYVHWMGPAMYIWDYHFRCSPSPRLLAGIWTKDAVWLGLGRFPPGAFRVCKVSIRSSWAACIQIFMAQRIEQLFGLHLAWDYRVIRQAQQQLSVSDWHRSRSRGSWKLHLTKSFYSNMFLSLFGPLLDRHNRRFKQGRLNLFRPP